MRLAIEGWAARKKVLDCSCVGVQIKPYFITSSSSNDLSRLNNALVCLGTGRRMRKTKTRSSRLRHRRRQKTRGAAFCAPLPWAAIFIA
jgi:hypothetical protein